MAGDRRLSRNQPIYPRGVRREPVRRRITSLEATDLQRRRPDAVSRSQGLQLDGAAGAPAKAICRRADHRVADCVGRSAVCDAGLVRDAENPGGFVMSVRITVTGGGGFLGEYVVRAFESRGYQVFVPRRADYDLTQELPVRRLFEDA